MSDTSKYLKLFVSEATQHATQLARNCAALSDETFQPELVHELFRHAHSIKGMSAAMGFHEIVALAHAVEQLLGELRGRAVRLPPATARILDEAVARLLEMISCRSAGNGSGEAPQIVRALKAAELGSTASGPDEAGLGAGRGR